MNGYDGHGNSRISCGCVRGRLPKGRQPRTMATCVRRWEMNSEGMEWNHIGSRITREQTSVFVHDTNDFSGPVAVWSGCAVCNVC